MSARPSLLALMVSVGTSLAVSGCGETNLVRDAAVAVGVTGGEPKPAPDFVSRTRSQTVDYVPVGTAAPPRPLKAKTAAEVSSAQTELDATRAATQARGAAAAAR